jgi:hypothetical protein
MHAPVFEISFQFINHPTIQRYEIQYFTYQENNETTELHLTDTQIANVRQQHTAQHTAL